MNVKCALWVTLMLFSNGPLFAQTHGYFESVDSTDFETNDGPNTAFYQQGFFSYGQHIPFDETDSLQTQFGSFFVEYGTRLKWKVNNWFAVGGELSYQFHSYKIKQDSLKNLLGLGHSNESQRLKRHILNSGLYMRINFGQRGNHLGRYLDLGGFGSWAIGSRLTLKRTDDPAAQNLASEEQIVTFRKLNFTAPLEYGVHARIGINKVILWGRYRFSDLFKQHDEINNGNQLPNLTTLSVGLQVVF